MGTFSSPQSGHRFDRKTMMFTHAIVADHISYRVWANIIEIYKDWQEIYAWIDVPNYSWEEICTEIIPRHLRDTVPLRILFLSIERDTSRGINHADGDNGKSFVRGARCTSERSHWLDVSTGEKLQLQMPWLWTTWIRTSKLHVVDVLRRSH